MAAADRFDAVTFDYWNTLVWEEAGHLRGRRTEAWAGLLEEAGFAMERSLLDAVFTQSWERYVEHWNSNQQYQSVRAAEELVEQLGFDVPANVRRELIEAFTDVGHDAELHLTDHVVEALRTLQAADIRLGIICDVGMTPSPVLRAHLERHGVLDLFDHWSFSDEVGAYKPARQIFEHALEGLGVALPTQAAHIGDLKRTDVSGALDMGMIAVRYTGSFDDTESEGPEATHVIADHAELPRILGLA